MPDSQPQNVLDRYMTPIAVLLAGVLIAGAIAYTRSSEPAAQAPEQAIAVDIAKVKTDGSPSVGNANAPVTMAVWFDYQCPFCKKFEQETLTKLHANYVESGKLRIVFKDFQFLDEHSKTPGHTEDSMTAALFGRAIWEAYPDRFYEWFTAMSNAQDEEFGGFGDLESIKTLTATLPGIDVARVTALMQEKKAAYTEAIVADRAEGTSFGIGGTPGSIVGTTFVNGAQPYEMVAALIDAELK